MRRWISIVLTIMMIGGMITAVPSVASAAEIDMIPTGLCLDQARDDVAAVITYDNSSTSEYSGTVELARTEENAIIEHIRKIDVLYDNKNVITIEPHDITATGDADNKTAINGYYAVTFMTEDNREVYLSTVSSGRSNLKIADTAGMFVNTLALGMNIEDVSVSDFLRQACDTFDQTLRHEDYPFARIATDYGFRPSIAYAYQVGVLSQYTVKGKPIGQELLELKVPKF